MNEEVIPQIKCSECGGSEFTRAGKNGTRVLSYNPRVVIQVQHWLCKNAQCRKHNFSQMDGTPIPELPRKRNKDSNNGGN